MMKKLINYLAISIFAISLVAPALVSGAGASLSSAAMNKTAGHTTWVASENANVGDEVYFNMTFVNNTQSPATGLMARVVLPSGLSYVNNYAKVYVNGVGTPVNDAIVSTGVSLPEVAAGQSMIVTYKTKTTKVGTYAPSNQLVGNGGLSLAANTGNVVVASGATTSVTTDSGSSAVTTTVTSGQTPGANQPAMGIVSSVLNYTKGGKSYTSAITADKGDEAFYRVTLTNNGDATATGLKFRTVLPSGLEYVPNYAKAYYKENGVDKQSPINDAILNTGVNAMDIPAHTFIYITFKVRVKADAVAGDYSASNQLTGNNGISQADNSGIITVSGENPVLQPAVGIVSSVLNYTKGDKSYSSAIKADRGDEAFYRVTITNNGSAAATGLKFRTVLPSGLEYVPNYAKAYYKENGVDKQSPINDAILNTGVNAMDIPAHTFIYITFKVRVKADAASGTYSASNQLTGNNGISQADNSGVITVSGATVNPVETKTLTLNASAKNATTNSGYSSKVNANRGDTIAFRVNFTNAGTMALNDVKITNALPSNMEFVKGSAKVTLAGNVISTADSNVASGANLGDLASGATGSIEFQAKIKSDTPANVTQLTYSARGTAEGINPVISVVDIVIPGTGTDTLPDTGMPTTILALVLLAMFLAVGSYVYLKETNGLKKVSSLIKR